MTFDAEQVRSAEDAGLTVVCGSVAFDDAELASLGISAASTGDDIVNVAVRLSVLLDLDVEAAAASLADLVQELRWFEDGD